MPRELDSFEAYKQMMGFTPRPAPAPEPDAAATRGTAPAQDGPLPVEDPWARDDERGQNLSVLAGIASELCAWIRSCEQDRKGCEALLRVLWAVKQREFDLREEA